MTRLTKPFGLRFPDGMRQRLKDLAAANQRSMNNQIIVILANALDDQSSVTAGPVAKQNPTVTSEHAALQGGAHVTQALGEPR